MLMMPNLNNMLPVNVIDSKLLQDTADALEPIKESIDNSYFTVGNKSYDIHGNQIEPNTSDGGSTASNISSGDPNQLIWTANDQFEAAQASAEKAMQFNAEQAQIQRDWEENMSNTSYQRAVKDLEAAGLNPILAVAGMSGASTPSGASASGYTASSANDNTIIATLISSLSDIINTAISSSAKSQSSQLASILRYLK